MILRILFRRALFRLGMLAAILIAFIGLARAEGASLVLLDPTGPLGEVWTEKSFGSPTLYRPIVVDGRAAIEASGRASASGLMREVDVKIRDHPILSWSWRVDRLPEGADIRRAEGDDYGAMLMVIFGRPGLMAKNPPTLCYVWINQGDMNGAVIVGPHHPEHIRSIVLRGGDRDLGRFVSERRDVVADYRLAFGTEPPAQIEALALWSDSDQTGADVLAYYGEVTASRRQERSGSR